jgi:uncharacterized protein YraI
MLARRIFLAAVLLISTPAIALAARGYVTSDVNMHAGPGTGYPVVDLIPSDARVTIHGCLSDYAWCDISWRGDRGWVSADYLDYFYNNRYVYFPDYADVIGVPILTFSLGTYWNEYYIGRPWYGRISYWQGYWQSHGRYGYSSRTRGNGSVDVRSRVTNGTYNRTRGNRPVGVHNRVTNETRVRTGRSRNIRTSTENRGHPNYVRGPSASNRNVRGRNPHLGRTNGPGTHAFGRADGAAMHTNATGRGTVGAGPHASVGHGNAVGRAVNNAAPKAKEHGR